MTDEQRKFLLQHSANKNDCKQFYSEYLELQSEGLTEWAIGQAFLTRKGERKLRELEKNEKTNSSS